jgi:hypothetical protein
MNAKTRYETDMPLVSDVTLDHIRAAARQYVRAGGSIFPSTNPSDVEEHIGNVVAELVGERREQAGDLFEQTLKAIAFPDPDDYGRLSNLATDYVAETGSAAFLFGAFVGLELAALTFGEAVTQSLSRTPRSGRRKRGGTR